MPAKSPLIAVVDDEECVRRSIVRLLRSAAMNAQAYACGADFLHDAAALQADCVVLDLHMPRVSGFDVQAHSGLRQVAERDLAELHDLNRGGVRPGGGKS